MMFRVILGVSICLNLVLAAIAVSRNSRASARVEATSPAFGDRASNAIPGEFSRNERVERAEPVPRPWKNLQNADLRVFTANLRAAGFPEQIVRKIIIAELDHQLAEDQQKGSLDMNFWKSGPERDEAERKAQEQKALAAVKRGERIQELLGPTVSQASGFGSTLWGVMMLTGVSDLDKLDRLSGIAGMFADRPTENKVARQKQEGEIRAILGPEGLEEFQLRRLAMEVMDVWGPEKLFGCIMTGAELRELLRIQNEASSATSPGIGSEAAETSADLQKSPDEQVRALLGEKRFQGYLRAKDGEFRQIHTVFEAEETMDLSWAVYDVYAELKRASAQLNDQPNLAPEERRAALLALRQRTERALQEKMGQEKFVTYVRKSPGHFSWLEELTVKDSVQP